MSFKCDLNVKSLFTQVYIYFARRFLLLNRSIQKISKNIELDLTLTLF
jgi:hypothetical protein